MSKYLYILDNGHGIETLKKQSPVWNDGSLLMEYEFNRNIVKYLSFMLRQSKIECEVLVPELKDITLIERCNRANKLGIKRDCLYISVHGNKFTDPRVHGFETHYKSESGKFFAEIFQRYIGKLGKNRGIKQSNFKVLRSTAMPAILTENGFYSNEKECKKMLTSEFQYEIASQHLKAIKKIESL